MEDRGEGGDGGERWMLMVVANTHSRASDAQGNRVLWWRSERDLDRGGVRGPEGQIVLRGHAGGL